METKKQVPNERPGEIFRKKLNEMETSKLPDTEFKTMDIRTPKELQQHERGHRNHKKEPVRKERYTN